LTKNTSHNRGQKKCEQNAKIHTWIYESPNLILGGIIIKEKDKKEKTKNIYIRKEGKEEVKERKGKENNGLMML
jgi:hypothetical protein